jgi:hypothetical protein
MLGEACGLAVLAAISPTALLVCAAFLGSANPTKTVLIYLLGAFLVTVVTGGIVFAALRAGHLDEPRQHQARDGLRLGLGLLMLIAGLAVLLLARRTGRNGRRPRRMLVKQRNGVTAKGAVAALLPGCWHGLAPARRSYLARPSMLRRSPSWRPSRSWRPRARAWSPASWRWLWS